MSVLRAIIQRDACNTTSALVTQKYFLIVYISDIMLNRMPIPLALRHINIWIQHPASRSPLSAFRFCKHFFEKKGGGVLVIVAAHPSHPDMRLDSLIER